MEPRQWYYQHVCAQSCLTLYDLVDGEGSGTPLQYSCLENPVDGGAWWAAVHGVTKSWTWLSDFPFTFHFHALEKEMATHSSVLAWRIPGTGRPGGLPSMGSHRVRHNWSDLAAAAADSSPRGSSVHGILQARILVWVAISFSRGSSWPRDRTCISCTALLLSHGNPHQEKTTILSMRSFTQTSR